MYHALVRRDGMWESFGLHTPSNQWSDFFDMLKAIYGTNNTAYLFWDDNALQQWNRATVTVRINANVADANAVEALLGAGELATHDDQLNRYSLAYHIERLTD